MSVPGTLPTFRVWPQNVGLTIKLGHSLTQAAHRAGYSKKTARVIGQENLLKPAIAAAIQQAMAERAARCEVDGDKVLMKTYEIAMADIRRVFDGTRLLPPNEWPDDIAFAIAGFDVVTVNKGEGMVEHVAKIKLANRQGYLDMLMRHLGLYDQDNKQQQPIIKIDREDAGA